MIRSLSRRSKVVLVSGAALVAGAVVVLNINGGSPEETLENSIASVVPSTAYKVAVLPGGENWWEAAASLMPAATGTAEFEANDLLSSSKAYGYFEYPAGEGDAEADAPVRVLAIETSSEIQAGELASWLDSQPGSEGRNGSVVGSIVTIVDTAHAPSEAPATVWDTPDGFAAQPNAASMWVKLDAALSPRADPAGESVMQKMLGFEEGSTSILGSADGKLWKGKWISGGFDDEAVRFDEAEKLLDENIEKSNITPKAEGDEDVAPSITVMTGGAVDVLPGLLASDHKADKSIGSLDLSGVPLDPAKVASGSVTALLKQRTINHFLLGHDWKDESSEFAAYGLSKEGLQVSFQ